MPPGGIDSLNADSLKGLVLSLPAKIDDLVEQNKALHEQNKTLLARIDELLARHCRTRGTSRQAAEDADELVAAAIEGTEGQRRGRVDHEERSQRASRRNTRALCQPRRDARCPRRALRLRHETARRRASARTRL
jgi:hypothetical protein